MKGIRVHVTKTLPFTTVGYWAFDGILNSGTLHLYCHPLSKNVYVWSVLGHELVEAIYCWLFGITTEECDRFDSGYEEAYRSGKISVEKDAGDDPKCPYRWGHWFGELWERFLITITFSSWKEYDEECTKLIHEMVKTPTISRKIIP